MVSERAKAAQARRYSGAAGPHPFRCRRRQHTRQARKRRAIAEQDS